jgi:hypothetical protein
MPDLGYDERGAETTQQVIFGERLGNETLDSDGRGLTLGIFGIPLGDEVGTLSRDNENGTVVISHVCLLTRRTGQPRFEC